MADSRIHLEVIHEGPHCMPCEYMAKVVETVAPEFGDLLHWEKVIITHRKGAFRYDDLRKELGRLPPVPSIFINGKLVFDITPGPERLREYLQSLILTSGNQKYMKSEFQEIGHLGFMHHNGGFQFREVSNTEFEFRATVQDFHLNSSGITHGGFIMSLMDSGLGTAVYRSLGANTRVATISLDVKFTAPSNAGDVLWGSANILKRTRSMVFIRGDLHRGNRLVATADGIWKILTAQ